VLRHITMLAATDEPTLMRKRKTALIYMEEASTRSYACDTVDGPSFTTNRPTSETSMPLSCRVIVSFEYTIANVTCRLDHVRSFFTFSAVALIARLRSTGAIPAPAVSSNNG